MILPLSSGIIEGCAGAAQIYSDDDQSFIMIFGQEFPGIACRRPINKIVLAKSVCCCTD